MVKQNKSFLDKIVSKPEKSFLYDVEEKQPERAESVAIEDKSDPGYDPDAVANESWAKNETDEDGQLAIDVYQDDNSIFIKSIIGGVRPEDLDLSVTSDMVTIKGTRQSNEEVKEDSYFYQECFWGSFSRSVILPCDIKADQVEASMKNGVLTIRLPKVEKNSATKIEVKGE